MNQILQVQEKKKNKNSRPIDTKKIVLFFSICIIIFGIIMLGQGAYSAYQNYKNRPVKSETPSGDIGTAENEPNIILTKTDEDKLIIRVESQTAISHIIYNWNNDTSATLDETGKTNIEEIIDIPSGENTIYLSVIDANGKETKKQETYTVEQSKPVIERSLIGNSIKITVTSKVELSYVTCKWNSEEEQKYDMITFEDRKKFEKTLEIPKGQNTLKIVAVDINNNQTESSMQMEGVPPANVPVPIARDGYIFFTIISETYNMEMVEFELNGEKQVMNTSTFGTTKEVNWRVKMVEGWNYLKITSKLSYDKVDTTNSTYWKFEYNP